MQRSLAGPGHAVQFYETESYLRQAVKLFLAEGLRSGQPAVVIATLEHCAVFEADLREDGLDVDALLRRGQLVWLDAEAILDDILIDGAPDPVLFRTLVGGALERAGGRSRVVRAYGEMVDILWARGNTSAALALEQLWNALSADVWFSLLCGYALHHFLKPDEAEAFERVCAHHRHVMPTEPFRLSTT